MILLAGSALSGCAEQSFESFPEPVFPDASSTPSRRRGDASTRDANGDQRSQDASSAPDGGVTPDADTSTELSWHRDIAPIIHAKCGLCHMSPPQFGAPRALMTYADLLAKNAFGQEVHELAAFRVVAQQGAMPPAGQPKLTMEEIAMIIEWSEGGAPEGDSGPDAGLVDTGIRTSDGGVPLPWADGGTSASPGPGLRWAEAFAHADGDRLTKYTAQRGAAGTTYICFGFDVPPNPDPNAMPESIIMAEPFIDNHVHVHHMVVFLDVERLGPDEATDCITTSFGSPVASWFPGRGSTTLPIGSGVPLPPNARLSIEIHYDSVPNAGALDMSGWRVLLSDAPGLLAAGEVWSGVVWPTPLAGPGNVTVQSTSTNTADNVTIFTATPHMHQKGLAISTEYRFAGDPPDQWRLLVAVDPWDFTHQILYQINPPLVLNSGDQIRTTCTWTTSLGPVGAGASSQNEMCYTFMYHYADPLLTNFTWVGEP